MKDQIPLGSLRVDEHVTNEQVTKWSSAANLMATIEAIALDGAIAVVKVDGARPAAIFTVVISSPNLGEEFFRKDGTDVLSLLRDAVAFYDAEVWSKRR